MENRRIVHGVFLVGICLLVSSCFDSWKKWDEGEKKETTGASKVIPAPLPEPFSDMALYELTHEQAGNAGITHKLHRAGRNLTSPSLECFVPIVDNNPSIAASEDILCWLDVEENDLFFHGINFGLYVKPGICDYVGFAPYYYWQWQPGNSRPVPPDDSKPGIVVEEGVAQCFHNNSRGYTSCYYDYTSLNGPNCDQGSYTLRTWAQNEEGICSWEDVVKPCEGQWKNCYAGPGATGEFLVQGVPSEKIVPSLVQGFDNRRQPWSFDAPYMSAQKSNLNLVNYLKMCVDENHQYTYKTYSSTGGSLYAYRNSGIDVMWMGPDHVMTTQPLLAYGTDHVVDPLRDSNPYYAFTCYDRAKDVKARIRVIVREWDRKFLPNDAALTKGNPDSGKVDPLMDVAGSEGSESDLGDWNDFVDWENLGLVPVDGGCKANNYKNFDFPNASL
jgi:hypothetical protein